MDLALPWSPPGLETNEKLPYGRWFLSWGPFQSTNPSECLVADSFFPGLPVNPLVL